MSSTRKPAKGPVAAFADEGTAIARAYRLGRLYDRITSDNSELPDRHIQHGPQTTKDLRGSRR
jgi:hypothetical protein